LSDNEVLCTQWESIARQLARIFGPSALGKPREAIVAEHELLLKLRAQLAAAASRLGNTRQA
jgi:hypothetical protein